MPGKMVCFIMRTRTDQCESMCNFCVFGKVLADFNPRHIGGDGAKWSADLIWSPWFKIISFEVAWSAVYEQQDHSRISWSHGTLGFVPQQLGQSHPAGRPIALSHGKPVSELY